MQYAQANKISLRNHPELTEAWLQARIEEDPSLLGLGDLEVKDVQRTHARGRLDLLLQDPQTKRRYEVEIQLGPTDPSHIVRVLEYWDIERKRFPQYDHCAVLIAEDITSRFLNVISLFHGSIPLIAIQATAAVIDGKVTLLFTKVMDELSRGLVDADEQVSPKADRKSWENHPGSAAYLAAVDGAFSIISKIKDGVSPNYTKNYTSTTYKGRSNNVLIFWHRKYGAYLELRVDQSKELDEILESSELEYESYNQKYGAYYIRLSAAEPVKELEAVMKYIMDRLDD